MSDALAGRVTRLQLAAVTLAAVAAVSGLSLVATGHDGPVVYGGLLIAAIASGVAIGSRKWSR